MVTRSGEDGLHRSVSHSWAVRSLTSFAVLIALDRRHYLLDRWGGPEMRKECWKACVQAKKEGKVKSIGISTFGVRHMKQLIEEDSDGLEVPAVHQVSGSHMDHP